MALLDTGVFCSTREDLRGFLTILLHLHQRWKPRRSKIRQTPVVCYFYLSILWIAPPYSKKLPSCPVSLVNPYNPGNFVPPLAGCQSGQRSLYTAPVPSMYQKQVRG
jgi:hypothetical protein